MKARIIFDIELFNGLESSIERSVKNYDNELADKFIAKTLGEGEDVKFINVIVKNAGGLDE